MKIKAKLPLSRKRSFNFAMLCLIFGAFLFGFAYFNRSNESDFGALNQSILNWMVENRSDISTSIAKVITNFAEPIVAILITSIIVFFWAINKRELKRPSLLVLAMMLMAAVSSILKKLIHNPRPDVINMIKPFESDYSFPSGHTLAIATFLLVIGYLIYSRNYRRNKMAIWVTLSFAGIVIIATTRLYLGYHWLTDTIASTGVAFMILATIITIDQITEIDDEEPKELALDTDQ